MSSEEWYAAQFYIVAGGVHEKCDGWLVAGIGIGSGGGRNSGRVCI